MSKSFGKKQHWLEKRQICTIHTGISVNFETGYLTSQQKESCYTPPRMRWGRFAKKPTPHKVSPPQSTSDSGTDDTGTDTTDDTGVCEECDGCL